MFVFVREREIGEFGNKKEKRGSKMREWDGVRTGESEKGQGIYIEREREREDVHGGAMRSICMHIWSRVG